MRIIEIIPLSNGGHRNQNGYFKTIPNGFAVVPNDLETPNFPFGEIEVTEIDGVATVTKWMAGKIPEPDSEQEVLSTDNITTDEMAAAIMEGVCDI